MPLQPRLVGRGNSISRKRASGRCITSRNMIAQRRKSHLVIALFVVVVITSTPAFSLSLSSTKTSNVPGFSLRLRQTPSLVWGEKAKRRDAPTEITMSHTETSANVAADTTSMFLTAAPSRTRIPSTNTHGSYAPATVHITSDLRQLKPSSLVHSSRDRGILGFKVDDSSTEDDSSLKATAQSSSGGNVDSPASPWRHMGDVDDRGGGKEATKDEKQALRWTSLSDFSSKRPQQRNVWKNNHVTAAISTPTDEEFIVSDADNNNKEEMSCWIPTSRQINQLTVAQLKAALRDRGQAVGGNKAELQQRLSQWATLQRAQLPKSLNSRSLTNFCKNFAMEPPRRRQKLRVPKPQKSGTSDTDFIQQDLDSWIDENEKNSMKDLGMGTANSLAEWSRTVDLEPLFQRREAIHREKQQGKPSRPKGNNKNKRNKKQQQQHQNSMSSSSLMSKEEYISVLKKVFDESSSSRYSNYEVRQMYAAAKEADQMGDRALSKRILNELKESTPHDARIYRRLARMEKEEGNVAQAKTLLQEGLRLDSENAFLWHGLGQLASSHSEAKTHYLKAIDCNPSLPMPYHALGTLEHTQGRVASAMKTLKQGLEYCPTNHRLHHALGDIYRDAKMLAMAEKCYRRALTHGPEVSHSFAYNALAYVAFEDGRPDACRSWLRKAVELNNGRNANGWVALAQLEEAEGNTAAARLVCMGGIARYEKGLLKRAASRIKSKKLSGSPYFASKDAGSDGATASEIRNRLMTQVPVYRSGDRFFNLYRTWARLEERYGTTESADEVYRRAMLAFPKQWNLAIDWAQHHARLNMYERASELYATACSEAAGQHGDPYRFHAEYEIGRGDYEKAQLILFRGAVALSQTAGGGLGHRNGMVELYYVWAVCEWHLGHMSRAETLLDHALRMTPPGEEGSASKCLILYAMAQLQYYQDEPLLAQHCIGLLLKENRMPGGTSKVWDLWADVADDLENESLRLQCEELGNKARAQEAANAPTLPSSLSTSPLSSSLSTSPLSSSSVAGQHGSLKPQLMRRDPWHHNIFGLDHRPRSLSFLDVRLPTDCLTEELEEQQLV